MAEEEDEETSRGEGRRETSNAYNVLAKELVKDNLVALLEAQDIQWSSCRLSCANRTLMIDNLNIPNYDVITKD